MNIVYIYIYIYCHPQTDCFVLSEPFSVARHVGRSKPVSKPIQLYVRLSLRPLSTFNKFPDFFVQAFKIVVDSWKFSMLLLYILWDDWPIFMISGLNEQLQQELEYTLQKSDYHSWWISKMQSRL